MSYEGWQVHCRIADRYGLPHADGITWQFATALADPIVLVLNEPDPIIGPAGTLVALTLTEHVEDGVDAVVRPMTSSPWKVPHRNVKRLPLDRLRYCPNA